MFQYCPIVGCELGVQHHSNSKLFLILERQNVSELPSAHALLCWTKSILFPFFVMINQMLHFSFPVKFLDLMFDISTLFYGGHLVLKGVISGGQLVSFILYSLELGGSLEVGKMDELVEKWYLYLQQLNMNAFIFFFITTSCYECIQCSMHLP